MSSEFIASSILLFSGRKRSQGKTRTRRTCWIACKPIFIFKVLCGLKKAVLPFDCEIQTPPFVIGWFIWVIDARFQYMIFVGDILTPSKFFDCNNNAKLKTSFNWLK